MVEITSPEIERIETKENKKPGKTTIFIIAAILLILIITGFAYSKMTGFALKENPKVLIETSEGNIKVELYPDKSPITVKNFLDYVESGTYEGTVFHRVIKDFMIQGGGYTETGEEKPKINYNIIKS